MSRVNFRRALCGLVLSLASLYMAAANATVYHLICRGGGSMKLDVEEVDLNQAITISWHYTRYTGSSGAIQTDGSHLGPGECSWSTARLSSSYTAFVHYASKEKLIFKTRGLKVDDSGRESSDVGEVFLNPLHSSDIDYSYLPLLTNPSTNKGVHSIFDPKRVYHIYVNVVGSHLELAYIRNFDDIF